jgi:hypothetical protein
VHSRYNSARTKQQKPLPTTVLLCILLRRNASPNLKSRPIYSRICHLCESERDAYAKRAKTPGKGQVPRCKKYERPWKLGYDLVNGVKVPTHIKMCCLCRVGERKEIRAKSFYGRIFTWEFWRWGQEDDSVEAKLREACSQVVASTVRPRRYSYTRSAE